MHLLISQAQTCTSHHLQFYLTKSKNSLQSFKDFKKFHPRMRREGRQHGMVRTYSILSEPLNPRRSQRSLNELVSPPAAGIFTKVPTKPTNHSKFTGKCGRAKCHDCHIHPVSKSRDKAKGCQKMRSSSDVVSNYRLITWRVVDSGPGFNGLKVSGFSATGVLDYLHCADGYDYDHDYEVEDSDHDHDHDHDQDDFNGSYEHEMTSHGVEIEEIDGCDDAIDVVYAIDVDDDDDDDDKMGFCEVGFVWEEAMEGDESWCLVEEI